MPKIHFSISYLRREKIRISKRVGEKNVISIFYLKIFKKDPFATHGASESAQQQQLSKIGLINCR
jgi:hypothetical protein